MNTNPIPGRAAAEPLTADELDRIAAAVAAGPAPGYPAQRLFLDMVDERDGVLIVPDRGPWHVPDHPNRRGAPSGALDPWTCRPGPQHAHDAAGTVDQHGRVVHPYWRQLLADPRIGLYTGYGAFWRAGSNLVSVALLFRQAPQLQVLLIRRSDNGRWALPAGYQNLSDAGPCAAALRELAEETGLRPPEPRARRIHWLLPVGWQTTLHAWPEHTIVLIETDPGWLEHAEPDRRDSAGEILDAAWHPVVALDGLRLQNGHFSYLQTGLRVRDTLA